MTMMTEDSEIDPMEIDDEEAPSIRRRVIGCCAIVIIIIFFVALIVGYTPWFRPYFP